MYVQKNDMSFLTKSQPYLCYLYGMADLYKLDGKFAVRCNDLFEWGEWMEDFSNTRVALDTIEGITVSTVFLGLDHNFFEHGDPHLFETMVFTEDGVSREQFRYFTWEEAETGHKEMVKFVQAEVADANFVGADVVAGLLAKFTHTEERDA